MNQEFHHLEVLWNPADLQASEAAFRVLLPEAQKLESQNPGYWIELMSWIARAEALQGNFTQARSSLSVAEKLLDEHKELVELSARVRWLIEKGRLHILEKTPSQARGYFAQAWPLAIQSGQDFFAVEIAQLMALSEPLKAQQEWMVRAIEIAEKSVIPKTKKLLGSLYMNLGWRFFESQQYEKSLESFKNALRVLKIQGAPREVFIAEWSIGKVLRNLGQTEEALQIQQKLFEEMKASGQSDGRLYEELAECLQTLKRVDEAQPYFELAYRELSSHQWNADHQPLKLKRLKDLGKVKFQKES